ncbi:hypothetical protein [uncultured Mediterranean phage]|nr:hypothetical protein [uncultured Mediterranean phage]
MSRQFSREFLLEVQKGKINKHTLVHLDGRNAGVPNGTWEFVNLLEFTAWPLSAATTVRVKAGGNAADTAAGAGARTVTVTGIDDSFNEVSETLTLAGASASSAGSTSFWRIHKAEVATCGTYGSCNTGNVDIENSGGGSDLIRIAAGEGRSMFCGWTVPLGKTAHLYTVHVHVDTNKDVDFRIFKRENIDDTSAPVSPTVQLLYFTGINGEHIHLTHSPHEAIPAKSDVWIEVKGDAGAGGVSASLELVVIDD